LFKRFWSLSQSPRWWLSAGAGFFLLSVLVGYHQDQISADSVLAGKIGVPPLVRVQDFNEDQHSNLLNEVQLLGEAALEHAVVVDLGTAGSPQLVQVVPVYPVTTASAPMALWYLRTVYDAVRRPVPRSLAFTMAEASEGLEAMERKACVFLISEGRVADDISVIGEGLNGPLVSLFGAETGGGELSVAARAALADRGLSITDDVQVIALYAGGKRPTSPVQDFSAPREALEVVALGFLAFGAIQSLYPHVRYRRRNAEAKFEEVQAVGEFPGIFEPIRSQEDFIRQQQDASEQHAAATRRVLSRMASEL